MYVISFWSGEIRRQDDGVSELDGSRLLFGGRRVGEGGTSGGYGHQEEG